MPFTRRSAFAAFAAVLAAPALALAQGATNAPAGGIPSTTAPSNSQGTPAGGTGVITRTPGAPASAGAPMVGGEMGTSETTHSTRHRRHRHRRVRHPAPSTAQ